MLHKHSATCTSWITACAAAAQTCTVYGKKPGSWGNWMENTHGLHRLWSQQVLSAPVFPCITFTPWPQWLRQWPPGTAGKAWQRGQSPKSPQQTAEHCICSEPVWHQQWSKHMLLEAACWDSNVAAVHSAAGRLGTGGAGCQPETHCQTA